MPVSAPASLRRLSERALQVSEFARRMLDAHGLEAWQFRFNRRKCALGFCYFDSQTVELSIHFVEGNSWEAIQDTLLHEIAHALVGPEHGHDEVWKRMCLQLGARPERVCRHANMPKGRWQARCQACGRSFHRHRRPKWLEGWFCYGCGEERGQLVWECQDRVEVV